MKVEVLAEAGYEQAMYGLSLSRNQNPEKMPPVADRLAGKGGGHDKFLEHIVVWLRIIAPRYWWQQFDTYRVGVSKQSESTMHTLMYRRLMQDDFAGELPWETLLRLESLRKAGQFKQFKAELPECFLQEREICTNYQTLRRIVYQRHDHELKEWQEFRDSLLEQVEYPGWLR